MSSGDMSSEYKEKPCGGAGQPLTKSENSDGKKLLSNGMLRVHRVLTDEEINNGRPTWWTELEIHGKVKNLSPALWQLTHLSCLFLNNNNLQRLPPEISQLSNLTMLDLSHNKIRSLPTELGDMISLCHLYLNNNQLRVLPYELGKLFRIQTLNLAGNPLSPEIAKIYNEPNGAQKILQFLLDHLTINTHPPPERNWVMIRHADPERPIATFTVLCYNVLCDKYATVNQYSYCPSWALNWEYRKTLIIKEIRTYEADVITLQEVETEQYRALFYTELKNLGYNGIFAPKTRAKTMGDEERKYVDGCAIFWKTDKFDMDKHHVFEFSTIAMAKASGSENIINRVMPRDNIGLCAVLKIKENVYANRRMSIPANDNVVGNPLVVCTAHIHWDPEFCDVKLVQSMTLANEVTRVLEEVSKKYMITQQQVPVLICGDFNSLPDSGVFEYLSKGQITRRHMDLKTFREDTCLEKFSSSTDKNILSHPLRLDSACDLTSIPFTNYTLDFKGMIDYIFATPQSLARLGILGPFDAQWVQSNKILGFPHPHVPSDHIPIMAQYAIIPTTHQRQPPPPQQTGQTAAGVIGSGYPTPPHHSFLR
ncbi:hypothetical protein CAEBREN_19479 [Caenorhabditis brenneri]|uniref:poly(A)-specific ribonuclease n=1 Tax=Caenorhabditis brenneri TaxID=135651 RepID=G0NYG0_CAEBE|nr:hypothetical protein CAEBREN_19479 [Caenorhabditis brenneri]